MASSWKTEKLCDLADMCLGKMLDQRKNKGEFFPYLANINVRWGHIDLENLREMKFEGKEFDRYGLKYGDIVMCEGGEPGRCAIWKEQTQSMMIQKALHRIRSKEGIDNFFLYYALLNKGLNGHFNSHFTGAAIKHLTGESLAKIDVDIPTLPIQKKIAGILSAYDDLIEKNLKRIKLLEEMARIIYEEWFIHLRFPGHETSPINDETGLPDRWETLPLGEVMDKLESGSRPKGGIDKDLVVGIPSVGAENVIGLGQYKFSAEKLVTEEFFSNMKRGHLCQKDILVYKDGAYIGKTSMFQDGFPHQKCAVNEHVFLINTKEKFYQNYLFFTLSREDYYLKMQGLNSNAAQPGLNQQKLKSLVIKKPSDDVLERFNCIVEPIVGAIFNLAKQNKKLSSARDLLLPRLMTGMIDVEKYNPSELLKEVA